MSNKAHINAESSLDDSTEDDDLSIMVLQQNTATPAESIDSVIYNNATDNGKMVCSVAKLFRAQSNKPYIIIAVCIGLEEFGDFLNEFPFSEVREKCNVFAGYIPQVKQLKEEVPHWSWFFMLKFSNTSPQHPLKDKHGYVCQPQPSKWNLEKCLTLLKEKLLAVNNVHDETI